MRGDWLKVGSLDRSAPRSRSLVGPLIGALLIIVTNAPLCALQRGPGLVYAVTMPLVALDRVRATSTSSVRDELAPEVEHGDLPAEVELA